MTTFLIVDDQELILDILQMQLEDQDYQVVKARNGIEALKKARMSQPDCVISDILMPEMDGFALCREWHRDSRLRNIPFVFFTATFTDSKDESLAYKLGAKRFITKPIEPDRLISIIQEVLVEVQKGTIKTIRNLPIVEEETFKLYNERLVSKLEKKISDLEREILERKKVEIEKDQLIHKLQLALDEIKTLRGIIPICTYCKKIRDDKGVWNRLEAYILKRSDAEFSHGVCPECFDDQMEELKK